MEILLSVVGFFVFFILLAQPLKYRLLLVLTCTVPQLYLIQISGSDVPVAFLLPMLLLPEFIKNANFFLARPTSLALLGLILISMVSLYWSLEKGIGIRDVAYLVEFLIITNAVCCLYQHNAYATYKIVNSMLFIICLQAVSVIVFRLNEQLELSVILSPLSNYLMGPNTLGSLLDGARNNFYDPEKAGGVLFVNANAAACYVGVSSFMAWGLFQVTKSKHTLIMAFFLWITVFFTGSKAGVMFALLIPFFAYYLSLKKSNKIVLLCAGITFVLALLIIASMLDFSAQHGFVNQSAETAESRYAIWKYALDAFVNNPVMGQGFGGWEADYSKHTDYFLPPHNTLIYLWSKSGLLASIMGLFFMVSCICLALRGLKNRDKERRSLNYAFFMVIAWQFAHGFGENFGLIGEQHQMAILAVMLGICMTGCSESRGIK